MPSSCAYCQSRLSVFHPLSLFNVFSMEQSVWDRVTCLLRSFQKSDLSILRSIGSYKICLLSVPMTSCWTSIFLSYYTTHWNSFCSSTKTGLFPLHDNYLSLFILPKALFSTGSFFLWLRSPSLRHLSWSDIVISQSLSITLSSNFPQALLLLEIVLFVCLFIWSWSLSEPRI